MAQRCTRTWSDDSRDPRALRRMTPPPDEPGFSQSSNSQNGQDLSTKELLSIIEMQQRKIDEKDRLLEEKEELIFDMGVKIEYREIVIKEKNKTIMEYRRQIQSQDEGHCQSTKRLIEEDLRMADDEHERLCYEFFHKVSRLDPHDYDRARIAYNLAVEATKGLDERLAGFVSVCKRLSSETDKKSYLPRRAPPSPEPYDKRLCVFCNGRHFEPNCIKYTTLKSRLARIETIGLETGHAPCHRCLGRFHVVDKCRTGHRCRRCGSLEHHTSLCPVSFGQRGSW